MDPWFNFRVSQKLDAVSQLCPSCGLCCNGVIFGDVELQPGDDPERLATLGMELFRKGRKKCFSQPCACFDGTLCRIYDDRPSRCRAFECRLLQRTQSGQLTAAYGLKAVKEARSSADVVRKLLRELGQTDERVPLSRRYAAVMAEPIDLAGDNAKVQRRSALMLAVFKLTRVLERDFLGGKAER